MRKREDFTLEGPINEYATLRDILIVALDIRDLLIEANKPKTTTETTTEETTIRVRY